MNAKPAKQSKISGVVEHLKQRFWPRRPQSFRKKEQLRRGSGPKVSGSTSDSAAWPFSGLSRALFCAVGCRESALMHLQAFAVRPTDFLVTHGRKFADLTC